MKWTVGLKYARIATNVDACLYLLHVSVHGLFLFSLFSFPFFFFLGVNYLLNLKSFRYAWMLPLKLNTFKMFHLNLKVSKNVLFKPSITFFSVNPIRHHAANWFVWILFQNLRFKWNSPKTPRLWFK